MIWNDQRLKRLAYVSKASVSLSPQDLIDISDAARENNKHHRITGLLLFIEGEFFQVIEGPGDEVEQLFSNIEKDPRNRWVTPLLRERPFFRIFRQWSMGCYESSFDSLPEDVFFHADWEQVKLRVNADHRQSFYRFLQRFYEANVLEQTEMAF